MSAAADIPRRTGYSIVRRLTVVVIGISLMVLAVNAWLFTQAIGPLGDNLVDSYAQQLVTVRQMLAQVPVAERPALARQLSRGDLQLALAAEATLDLSQTGQDPLGRQLNERLARALPALAVVTHQPQGAEVEPDKPAYLQMSFLLDGQRWDLRLPMSRPPMFWPLLPALVLLGLVGLAATLVASTSIRIIAQPVATISRLLGERHHGLRPIDEHPSMGRELQQIVHAFNGLARAMEASQATRRHMLAGLSHDLRTPLTRLRLRVECECPPDAIAVMEGDFDALARIIDQFLAFTQGEAGVSLGQPEAVSQLARHVHRRYQDRDCAVTLVMEEQACVSVLPDLAVLRILTNLVDNALAHGQGPVEMRVRADPQHCELLVADRGPGLSPEAFAAARRPFVKLNRRDRELGHCGLGLAIIDQLAQQLGGEMVHRQPAAGGCEIGVRVPLRQAGVAPA